MCGLAKIERVCAWYRAQLVGYSDMETVFLYLGVLVLWLAWLAWVTVGHLFLFGSTFVLFREVFRVENPFVYFGIFLTFVVMWLSHVGKVLSV